MNKVYVTAIVKDVPAEEYGHYLNGTAMGCMENTVQMLNGLAAEGEAVNMPTCFMQSTHNTVASMIAIYTKNHGYNTTYSHRTISFELALQDAFLRLRTGLARTALVCVNDELTELQLQQPHFFGQMEVHDRSEAWMLSVEPGDHPLYELENVKTIHQKGSEDRAEIQIKPL